MIMVSPLGHLILFIFISHVCSSTEETNCSKFFTSDFSYGHFHKISDLKSSGNGALLFEFEVKSLSDAHIKFSERPFPAKMEAAYEVVIGAGKNTFSFIRRMEYELSKIRLDTPAILSPEQKRGFWVRIRKHGMIQVGKKGEVYPFMEWEDEHPLDIKYFSFSSWENISAEWDFNCTKIKEKDPNSKSQGKKTDIIQFFLERDYDINVEPPINPETSNYTNMYIHLTCNYVNLVDERSILVLNGELSMLWEDSRMTWSAEENGRQHLDFDSFEVWTPEVVLRNNAHLGLEFYNIRYSKVRVYSNGTSFWKRAVHFTAFCKGIDHQKWPQDTHVCELQLGLICPHSSLQMIPMKDEIYLEKSRMHTGWDIVKVNVTTKWIPSSKNIKKDLKAMNYPEPNHIIIEFNLSRSNNFYYTALMILLATISILTLLSFWASPLGLLKVGIQCFTFVIVCLSVMFCWKVIPNHNNKDFPSVFSAFIIIMHMVWVSIASSVLLSSVTFFAPVSIPSSVSGFLKSKLLAMLFCLPQPSNKVAMYYNRLCDGSILSKEHSQDYSFKSKECELQWNWILISIIIERILFFTYIGLFSYAFSILN